MQQAIKSGGSASRSRFQAQAHRLSRESTVGLAVTNHPRFWITLNVRGFLRERGMSICVAHPFVCPPGDLVKKAGYVMAVSRELAIIKTCPGFIIIVVGVRDDFDRHVI